jgi:Rrf2 family transcriptional regulator, iron-sulfur cluster assembly transcription factor
MQLSTRSRYAINAMIELALHQTHGPIALAELSRKHCVSVSYLELVFSMLRKSGLVEATRGPGGGYSLGLRGAQISIAEIVAVVDSAHTQDKLPLSEVASNAIPDMTQGIWDGLHATAHAYLQSVTLNSLAIKHKRTELAQPSPTLAVNSVVKHHQNRVTKVEAPDTGFALGQVWLGKQ